MNWIMLYYIYNVVFFQTCKKFKKVGISPSFIYLIHWFVSMIIQLYFIFVTLVFYLFSKSNLVDLWYGFLSTVNFEIEMTLHRH